MNQATARAGANIALVKYWGKRDTRLNLPAAGSLSITLAGLETVTRLTVDPELSADCLSLDGREQPSERVAAVLDLLRRRSGQRGYCRVESRNNFPTGAGLASSASGFAALVVAGARVFDYDAPAAELSELARHGSGSAARSIFGGFVVMDPGASADGSDAVARPLLAPGDWPLEVVVAVTDRAAKGIASRQGMNRTTETSPYHRAWVDSVPADLRGAEAAVAERDFEALAEVAEHSALKMHGSMLAARPGLVYWNPATVACIHRIRSLRAAGTGVFFTIDAGPQVKAVCRPDEAEAVADALRAIDGVSDVVRSPLGPGAEAIEG
jgi:diphosphomevalonate decarboxylase